MILEFISTAVETQPGLVELFLDLSSKEDQVSFLVMFDEKQTNNQIIKTSQKKCVLFDVHPGKYSFWLLDCR